MSVTVGLLGENVIKSNIQKLVCLLREHCMAGVVTLEKGDIENRLHFQMVYTACCKSALSFKIIVCKYMGWYDQKDMDPKGRVVCKTLTNKQLHTFRGMMGYCLKDIRVEHFECVIFNISNDNIIEGKTLHAIFGRSDLKQRVVLTNKNITNRMYVWYKYKVDRKLMSLFLSVLVEMILSGLFILAIAWIIPFIGYDMDHCV